MSFLFKAVLGERVVHPPAKDSATSVGAVGEPHRASSPPTAGGDAPAAVAVSKLDDGRVIAARHFPFESMEGNRESGVAATSRAAGSHGDGLPANGPGLHPLSNGTQEEKGGSAVCPPPPFKKRSPPLAGAKTETRTLLLRVQTCTVAQDLREALRELYEGCPDLPYVTAARELKHFVNLLSEHMDDWDIVSCVTAILSGVTDTATYPTYSDGTQGDDELDLSADQASRGRQDAENDRKRRAKQRERDGVYAVSEKEKRQIKNSFLHELASEAPVLLEVLRTQPEESIVSSLAVRAPSSPSGVLWVRLQCLRLLSRLEEYNPAEVHRQILECHGVGVLVDLLGYRDGNGVLRGEALTLISSMTSTETSLQTLVAFENGFDALFAFAEEAGGVDGGPTVAQCLATVHNLLRGNPSTQKLFLQMGCAHHLSSFFDAVPKQLAAVASVGAGRASAPSKMPNVSEEQSVNLLSAVSVLACLLREAETNSHPSQTTGASSSSAQTELVASGVLRPIAALALCGPVAGDAVRIEALRVLAALLDGCKPAILNVLIPCTEEDATRGMSDGVTAPRQQPSASPGFAGGNAAIVTLLKADTTSTPLVVWWSPLRALLEIVFTTADRTLLGASTRLLDILLTMALRSPEVETALTTEFLNGFAAVPGVSGFTASNHHTVRSSGGALALALTGPTPHAVGKFYAARLLASLLKLSDVAERLATRNWTPPSGANVMNRGSFLAPDLPLTGESRVTLPTNTLVTLSTALPPTFVNAYVSYLLFCLGGSHASQHMDTNALGAYTYALLVWLECTAPDAARALLQDHHWFTRIVHLAANHAQVNVRLWCASVAATLCYQAPSSSETTANGTPPATLPCRQDLSSVFSRALGGAVVFDNLCFDVSASTPQWLDPVADVFSASTASTAASGGNVIYDTAFVVCLQRVKESFAQMCPPPASAPTDSRLHEASPVQMGVVDSQPAPRIHDDVTGANSAAMAYRDSRSANHAPDSAPLEAEATAHGECCARISVLEAEKSALEISLMQERTSMAQLKDENARLNEVLAATREAATHHQMEPAPPDAGDVKEEGATVAIEKAREEAQRQWAEQVAQLEEHTRLLEEALSGKDEELAQLAHSLNMMELQLQQQQQKQHPEGEATGGGPPSVVPATMPSEAAALPPACVRWEAGVQTEPSREPPNAAATLTTGPVPALDTSAWNEDEVLALMATLDSITQERDALLLLVGELSKERQAAAPSAVVTGNAQAREEAHVTTESSPVPLMGTRAEERAREPEEYMHSAGDTWTHVTPHDADPRLLSGPASLRETTDTNTEELFFSGGSTLKYDSLSGTENTDGPTATIPGTFDSAVGNISSPPHVASGIPVGKEFTQLPPVPTHEHSDPTRCPLEETVTNAALPTSYNIDLKPWLPSQGTPRQEHVQQNRMPDTTAATDTATPNDAVEGALLHRDDGVGEELELTEDTDEAFFAYAHMEERHITGELFSATAPAADGQLAPPESAAVVASWPHGDGGRPLQNPFAQTTTVTPIVEEPSEGNEFESEAPSPAPPVDAQGPGKVYAPTQPQAAEGEAPGSVSATPGSADYHQNPFASRREQDVPQGFRVSDTDAEPASLAASTHLHDRDGDFFGAPGGRASSVGNPFGVTSTTAGAMVGDTDEDAAYFDLR